jgi:hypothetical protein
MEAAVIPQIRVEPELRDELESVLNEGETLTDFVEATVRNVMAFRRVQTDFHARAQAASAKYHRSGITVPVDAVLDRLQSKLDAKRKKLGRCPSLSSFRRLPKWTWSGCIQRFWQAKVQLHRPMHPESWKGRKIGLGNRKGHGPICRVTVIKWAS